MVQIQPPRTDVSTVIQLHYHYFEVAKIKYPSRGNKYSIHSTLGYVQWYWFLWLGRFGQNPPMVHWFVLRHAYELSLFGMAKIICASWGNDKLLNLSIGLLWTDWYLTCMVNMFVPAMNGSKMLVVWIPRDAAEGVSIFFWKQSVFWWLWYSKYRPKV